MAQSQTEIGTGVERKNTDVPVDADVYAFVDDGEHAVVWAVTRNSDHEVTVTAWLAEAGLIDRDTTFGLKHFDVPSDEETIQWAESYAKAHKGSIEHARAHFEN